MDDEERCPIPECDLHFHATGLHTDAEGFSWRQSPREAAEEREDAIAKERAIERALEGMP